MQGGQLYWRLRADRSDGNVDITDNGDERDH